MTIAARFALLASVGLAGCAATGPAPIESRTGAVEPPRFERPAKRAAAAPARPVTAPAPTPPEPRPYPVVAAGDWAEGPGTPLSTWALQPEDAQPFDPAALPKAHAVKPGETLFTLSARYQVPLRALIEVNRLEAPFALNVGQVLSLPPPRIHRVRAGETLVAIAGRYNVDARSLAVMNRMAAPFTVRPGDRLALPALARAQAREFVDQPQAETAPAPGPASAKPAIRLAWPLTGKILTRFGPLPGNRRSDGIDIAAAEGAPVKAAADGMVVYAGNDLPGYGNLILIQHTGGWVTAYAQARSLKRAEGARVKQGDVIAEVGGGPSGARLHFQVRRGSQPADPLAALPPA
jgi:lipoprotein NlpD